MLHSYTLVLVSFLLVLVLVLNSSDIRTTSFFSLLPSVSEGGRERRRGRGRGRRRAGRERARVVQVKRSRRYLSATLSLSCSNRSRSLRRGVVSFPPFRSVCLS